MKETTIILQTYKYRLSESWFIASSQDWSPLISPHLMQLKKNQKLLTHSVYAIYSDSLCIYDIFTGERREGRTTTLSELFVTITQEHGVVHSNVLL